MRKMNFIGKNLDGNENLLVTVEELMNPFIGLCYAIIPSENFKLQLEELITLEAKFETLVSGRANWNL